MLKRIVARLFGRQHTIQQAEDTASVPIKDEYGNVTGIMDNATAAYLQSDVPDPSQQILDAMLADVSRVKVFDGGMNDDKPLETTVLLDVADQQVIALLRQCLTIVENPESFGHCMCYGDLSMEFYVVQKRKAAIGFHHGNSIRWNAWKHDALLQDGQCYLKWLAEQGVAAPLSAYKEARQQQEEAQQAWNRWVGAMPDCLRELSPEIWQIIVEENNLQPATDALASAYPTVTERLLTLFRWFGSGTGPWTGFPAYEQLAEQILLQYSVKDLVTALESAPLTEVELEGAARLFAGHAFQNRSENQVIKPEAIRFTNMAVFIPARSDEPALIPSALGQQLLEHSLTSSDEDKIDRAKKAFSS
jgi:hypothetical protein